MSAADNILAGPTTSVAPPLSGVRIVVVNNFPGPGLGGGETLALTLVAGLRDAGADVRAVVAPGSGFGARLADDGVVVTEAPMSVAATQRAVSAIRAAADGAQRCILLGTGYFTGILVRLASRARDVRVAQIVGVTPGASLSDGGSRAGLALRKLAENATADSVDAWIAVADIVAKALIADGAPRERVHVIRNGVDAEAIRAVAGVPAPGLPGSGALVCCVARLEPVKGVEFLVRAAALLPGVRVAIAGDGPLESQLRELATALDVADRVAFLGQVPSVAPLLAQADVVAMPSLSEGLPMVALEAMALGKPLVASRVGGIPEVVEDGVTGRLVPPGDPISLAEAIRDLLGDAQLRQVLGRAAEQRVRERFSASAMVGAYVELFCGLA